MGDLGDSLETLRFTPQWVNFPFAAFRCVSSLSSFCLLLLLLLLVFLSNIFGACSMLKIEFNFRHAQINIFIMRGARASCNFLIPTAPKKRALKNKQNMGRKRTFHLAVVRLWVGAALANSLFTARICAVPDPLSARRLGAGRDHKVRACRRLKSERTRFKPLPLPAKGRAWLCHKGVYRDRAKEWKKGGGRTILCCILCVAFTFSGANQCSRH